MFSQQELDNAVAIMVEQLETELQQNIINLTIIIKTSDKIAFDIGITNDSVPEKLLNMRTWQLISLDPKFLSANEYRYRVSAEGVAVIAAYVKQAYDQACNWLNEADFTATLHGKKSSWMPCYEGLGEIRHDARVISEFQRGLRFYQHQVAELKEFYKGSGGDDQRKKEATEAFRKVAQKLDQAFKDPIRPLGRKEDLGIKKHLTEHEDYKKYKCYGIFMLLVINYEMIRVALNKKKAFPKKVIIRRPLLVLHYSSDEDEQLKPITTVQSTTTILSNITYPPKLSRNLPRELPPSQQPSFEDQLASLDSEHFSQNEITSYQNEMDFFAEQAKPDEIEMGAQPLEYENFPLQATPQKEEHKTNNGNENKRQRLYSPTQFGLATKTDNDKLPKASLKAKGENNDDSQKSCEI